MCSQPSVERLLLIKVDSNKFNIKVSFLLKKRKSKLNLLHVIVFIYCIHNCRRYVFNFCCKNKIPFAILFLKTMSVLSFLLIFLYKHIILHIIILYKIIILFNQIFYYLKNFETYSNDLI